MDVLKSNSLTLPSSTKNTFANSNKFSTSSNPSNPKYDPLSKNKGNHHISFQTLIKQKSATSKESNINNQNNDNNLIKSGNQNPTFQNNITENNSKINKNYISKEDESLKRQNLVNINTHNHTNGIYKC
jgi:hypothetical protein